MKVLITGGLGYIGSHVSYLLGNKSIIIDDMSNSKLNYKKYLPKAIVYKKRISLSSLRKIFNDHRIGCVIHFAAFKSVSNSIQYPLKYYENNISSTINLLIAMNESKIKKLIFSSSATVYGNNQSSPFKENFNLSSVNPYGNTKIFIEKIIDDYSKSHKDFRAISLRYFNPIGANTKANLFDKPLGKPENLIPLIIESIIKKKKLLIYGNNYSTKDGTCIRDYIHINDLAEAHMLSIDALNKLYGHTPINIGLGKGISVLQLIKLFEKVNKVKINYEFTSRRQGDVGVSYADNSISRKLLKWNPSYNYRDMVKDSWESAKKYYDV